MLNTIAEVKILLIEDEAYDIKRVEATLKPFSEKLKIVSAVSSGVEAIELLKNNQQGYDVIVMDYQISGGLMGEALIREIKEIDSTYQIIVITKITLNIANLDYASDLISAGAYWYCTKYPGDIQYIYQPTDFILSIVNAYEKRKIEQERIKSKNKLSRGVEDILEHRRIIGESEIMLELKKRIIKCANNNANVLICGASGTGKELVAANIHYSSQRKFENFVAINCGSIPEELIESELFGYEKGAFTGANKSKPGLFEQANNGTVFLDEITELPLSSQVKLLRVLQEGEIEKIGRTEKIKVNVRIISATNKDIGKEVVENKFRQDLYYRLNVVQVNVPDLKDRKEDIPLLLDHFMGIFSVETKRNKPALDNHALKLLLDYEWPGNVREMKNVIQRLLFDVEDEIKVQDVNQALIRLNLNGISMDSVFTTILETKDILSLPDAKRLFKAKYVTYVRNNSESDADTASKLGLAPSNFHRLCKELGLK
jgi:two-component system, NtrC family, response regulator AtoC